MSNIPTTTEELREEAMGIGQALRSGKISNSVARTLLLGTKVALDTLRTEMEATRLGADFYAVELSQDNRIKKAVVTRAA